MDLSEIIRAIRALPEAETMSVVTGSLDLLVRLRVRDHTHLRELLLTKIFQITGVQRTETFLSLADVEPDNFAAAMLEDMISAARHLDPHLTAQAPAAWRSQLGPSTAGTRIDGVGQPGFVARHGLYTAEQAAAADEVAARIRELGLRTVRLVVVDQHGVPRSKSLSPEVAIAAMSNGLDFSGAIYSLDTGNQVFVPAFAAGGGFGIDEFTGFPDVVLVPDPATFRVLPWADRTGWMLCDVYFSSGAPMPLDGRGLMRRALAELGDAGYDFLAGIEVEYYIVKLDSDRIVPENAGFTPPPPAVSVFERGYQYLSEVRLDSVAGTLEAIRDGLTAVGLPPRSMEDEWGPGQMEFSFSPIGGLAAADAVVLFRSAVKQMCQRRGLLATFMCRPALPNFFSSGWHLHESLISRAGRAQRVRQPGRVAVGRRAPVRGRAARARDADDAVRHAHRQRLQALPAVLLRPRPGLLGGGEPRRAGPGAGRAGRREQPRGEPDGRARRQPVPLHGGQHRRRASTASAAQLEPPPPVEADPYAARGADAARRRCATRSARWPRTPSTARRSATPSSTTCSR